MKRRIVAAIGCVLFSASLPAQSVFEGTWRPDPQKPGPHEQPDVLELAQGYYECKTCRPPYRVKADGTDQKIEGNPRYDTLAVTVVDAHAIRKTAKKDGHVVMESSVVISADGGTKTETQTVTGIVPKPVEFATRSQRAAPGATGAHVVSGTWQVLEGDLVNHEEDTTYRLVDGKLQMSDLLGRSFLTPLDGTETPYLGDPRFTSVSLKLVDATTLEETDKNGTTAVMVTRWSVGPDGRTMHARFDDMHGHVMEQSGHKLP